MVVIGKAYDEITHLWVSEGFNRKNGIEPHKRAIAFAKSLTRAGTWTKFPLHSNFTRAAGIRSPKILALFIMNDAAKLILIKLAHTAIWAIFASSIVAIPVFTYLNQQSYAWYLIAFVLFEVVVLIANQMRCPLTVIASRYTDAREDNFDIYLPLWVARYNKFIFGVLYLVGIFYAAFVQLFQHGVA